MEHNKLIKTLINLGLSENEAKTYYALLSLGPASVLQISRAADIKRTTVYTNLEFLKQKGLVNLEIKGFKKLFVAEEPNKLERIIESRKEELKNVLPEFNALFNLKGSQSHIKYYEGIESIKLVYDQVLEGLNYKDYYLAISDAQRWRVQDSEYFDAFLKKRRKLSLQGRIEVKMLLQNSLFAQDYLEFQKNYGEKTKILPAQTELVTNFLTTPNCVVIHQLTVPVMAVVIENRSVVQMGKQMFEIMWNAL